jgi:hypothetical protein
VNKGLSPGAIAGIAIGAVAVVAGTGTAAFCLLRKPGGRGEIAAILETSEPIETGASWGVEGGEHEDNLWGDGGGELNEFPDE